MHANLHASHPWVFMVINTHMGLLLLSMVMMITAYATVENAVAAFQRGAHDYLMKPVIFEELLSKIGRLIGYRQLLRENHALREQNFFGSANSTLDEYLERGRAVLGDLGDQREMLKGTQRKLYSVGTTMGISGDTIRMVERRAKEDKWIFWGGVLVFCVFVYFVLKFFR